MLQRFKYLDTLDPAGKQEMVFAVPDPPRDSKYYPRLQVWWCLLVGLMGNAQ